MCKDYLKHSFPSTPSGSNEYSSFFKRHQQIYTLPKQNKTSDLKKGAFPRQNTIFFFCLSFMLKMILFQLACFACYLIYGSRELFVPFFPSATKAKENSQVHFCVVVYFFHILWFMERNNFAARWTDGVCCESYSKALNRWLKTAGKFIVELFLN